MKRLLLVVFGLLALGAWLSGGSRSSAQPAAPTVVCGTIPNTTLTLSGSPYSMCASGVFVPAGVTLTVDPGVTLQFAAGDGNKLTVAGTLNATGSAAQPILFSGTATKGSWAGVYVSGTALQPASVNLDYVTLEYGGLAGSAALLYTDQASVTIAHSTLRNSLGNGFMASTTVAFNIQSTSFTGNAEDALRLDTPVHDMLLGGLSASGNGLNAVHVLSATLIHGQKHWANPGIVYQVDGSLANSFGDQLTIDPGSQFQFGTASFLSIGGRLVAHGTQAAPILMTGETATPGAWRGLVVSGPLAAQPAVADLDYVTVEYGGNDASGANIYLASGQVNAHHSIIRFSSKDGVRFDPSSGGSLLNNQIYGNTLYGAYNSQPTHGVLATNNWWGSASGPASDVAACPVGTGDKVTAGVFYRPILATPTAVSLPLSSVPTLTITPRRWFTPADGVTRDYFDLTLRDGNGAPIPGRVTRISSSLGGTLVDGGITDANGHALAYLTSTITGDSNVSASLDGLTGCEGVMSPVSTVTFSTPPAFTELMPNGQAPYLNGDISLSPLPVITGVPETISAKLTNPLSVSVTVNVEFDYAQSGIGLTFGPIKTITGQVIPANSSVVLTAGFVPPVSGHYCAQVIYDITAQGAVVLSPQAVSQTQQLKPFNFNSQPSSTGGSGKPDGLAKTRNSLKQVNRFVGRAYDNSIAVPLAVANAGIEWDLNNADKISNALQGDPPRQDYTVVTVPNKLMLPPVVADGVNISVARANALNALDSDLASANAYGLAADIALDRDGGASAAGDLQWASTQAGVMLEYERQMGVALVAAAQDITALVTVATNEGQGSVIITASDVLALQAGLAGGFSAQEIADAKALGLSDTDIEAIRQSILTANPNDLAGDYVQKMVALGNQFANLGLILQNLGVFNPGFSVSGGAGLQAQATGNTMAQVYDSVITFPLANTTGAAALITVQARRIDLPPDWTVDVSPNQVNLANGAQTTVTLTVGAGSPVPQGSLPQVAVEAYANGALLGGVTFQLVVPSYAPFDGKLRVYMPSVRK